MKTVKKTATLRKTLRYEVSVPLGEIFATNDKVLAQEQAEKLKSEFANEIYFDDHKLKQHWIYQRLPNQKNYRIFMGHYVAPKVEVETPVIES